MGIIKCIVCVASLVVALLLFSDNLLAVRLLPASMYKRLTQTYPYMYHNHRIGADLPIKVGTNRRPSLRYLDQSDHGDEHRAVREGSCLFIPDCSVNAFDPDVQAMMDDRLASISVISHCKDGEERKYKVSWTSLPNVQLLNDKRYEIKWLEYIHSLNVSSYDVIVADKVSAEAILRYAEGTNKTKDISAVSAQFINALVLIDCPDIYTAGERHGREFRTSCISRHCATVSLIATNEQAYKEACNLKQQFANNGIHLLMYEHDQIQMEGCISTHSQQVLLQGDGNTRGPSKLLEMIKAVIASL